MSRRRRIIALAVVAALAGAMAYRWLAPREPAWQGQPISYWIDEMRVSSGGADEFARPFIAMGSNAAPWLIREFGKEDSRLWTSFVSLCQKLPPEIFDALPRPGLTPSTRQSAAVALEKIGPPAFPTLIRAARDLNRNVRFFTTLVLGRIHPLSSEAAEALLRLFRDPDAEIRMAAATALGRNLDAHQRVMTSLVAGLDDAWRSSFEREKLALVLVFAGPAGFPTLLQSLQHTNAGVRLAITQALAKMEIANTNRTRALLVALRDADPPVRAKAAELLGERERTKYLPPSPEAAAALLAAVHDPDAAVRRSITDSLMRCGVKADIMVPLLVQQLKETSPNDRQQAANWLSYFGAAAKSAVPALVEALQDEAVVVRFAAATTLSEVAPDRCETVPVLIECVTASELLVRESAVSTLGKFLPCAATAIPALKTFLTNESAAIQTFAARALTEFGKAALPAMPELIRLVQIGEVETRIQAMNTLANFGPTARAALPGISVALTSGSEWERAAACRALGLIGAGDPEVIGLLIETANSPREEFRLPAIQSLGWLGATNERVHAVLSRAADDASPWIRLAGIQALIDAKLPLEECVPPLQSLLKTFNQPATLSNQTSGNFPTDLSANYEAKKRICQAIIALGPIAKPIVPDLIELLEGRPPFGAELSALTLGELKFVASNAIPALAKMLASPSAYPRYCAAVALQNILPDAATQFPHLPNILTELHAATNFFMTPDPRDWLTRQDSIQTSPGQIIFLGNPPPR